MFQDHEYTQYLQSVQFHEISLKEKTLQVQYPIHQNNARFLKVRDIELLPNVLKQPLSVKIDKRKGKLYFGKRKGVNKSPFLKVVVRIEKNGTETIITVCSSKRCT